MKPFKAIIFSLMLFMGNAELAKADQTKERLEIAIEWSNNAIESLRNREPMPSIKMVLLEMTDESQKEYIAAAFPTQNIDIGTPGLSATIQKGTSIDGVKVDTCFLLYNSNARSELVTQFIAPDEKAYGPSIVPYIFLVFHELGHCIQSLPQEGPTDNRPLNAEIHADLFAIRALGLAKIPPSRLKQLLASRQNSSKTHSTYKWLPDEVKK